MIFLQKDTDDHQAYKEIFNVIGHKGNLNQNRNIYLQLPG